MAVAGDRPNWPMKSQKHDRLVLQGIVDIGASGAATLSGDKSILTCAKNTTGVYDVTFEPLSAQATSLAIPEVFITKSAAATVCGTLILAFSPTAGTMQFSTFLGDAGTPVQPANGDQIGIRITGGFTGIL